MFWRPLACLCALAILFSIPKVHASNLMIALERCGSQNEDVARSLALITMLSLPALSLAVPKSEFEAELALWRQAYIQRETAVVKWSVTLCVYQIIEGQFGGDLDLNAIDQDYGARVVMNEIALFDGFLRAEQSRTLHFSSLADSIQRKAMAAAIHQFLEGVAKAQANGKDITLRALAMDQLGEVQREVQKASAAIFFRFGHRFN